MKQTEATTSSKTFFSRPAPDINNKLIIAAWAAILLMVNYPLFFGDVRSQLIFFPDAVLAGQWWRVLTHPFVHLSWYHLLLDGLAFVVLYHLLEERRNFVKLFYSITAGMGALLFSLLVDPAIYQRGLCGLSGAAHGLMAISALEMLRHRPQRGLGLLCLGIVVAKSIYEFCSGQVFLESMHMGLTGQPVAASHAGGVLGGLLAFVSIKIISAIPVNRKEKNRQVGATACYVAQKDALHNQFATLTLPVTSKLQNLNQKSTKA